ncbi:unnamed protein product, partial [Closterium sp. NIES-53]
MHSRLLVTCLPRSLPPLPPSPALPCLPCVEGWQRAAPHSSSFPPTTAPLQTLHMDVWGPARVNGQGRECYFLLVVDDYTRYTTVFTLRSKGQDLPVLRLHSDRGGEFSSDLLWDFCHGEGIRQSFTLPDSPQQNGIAERCIGLVMEVARTSMIHAAAPHFLWPFAVRYAAHQLNLWPRVSLPETSPTLRWTGEVGDALVFRVWGSRAFVRDTFADKLSACAIPCVFLGFVPDAPDWQFYHPTSRHVFPSQDVTFDEPVPFYRLFPYRSAPPPPPPLFLAPGPPPVDPLPPQCPTPSGVSHVDPLPGTAPVEVAVSSGAARGAASGGAEPGGAESEGSGSGGAELGGEEPGGAEPTGVEPGGTEPEGVEPGGAKSEGAESGGAEPRGAALPGSPAGASPRLSPQQLREWLDQRARLWSGATGAGGTGDAGAGGAGVTAGAGGTGGAHTRGTGAAGTGGVGCAGAGDPKEPGAAGARGSGAGGAGAGGTGAGSTRAGGAGVGGTDVAGAGAGGAGGTVRPRPYFVPLLQHVLGVPSSTSLSPPLLCPPPNQSQPLLLSASPLPAPSPYTEQSGGLIERYEPASRPVLPVWTAHRVPHSRPPLVPGTHAMALRPSSVPLRVPLPAPPESSLPESAVASALVAELLDLAAACRLDYATALFAESDSASPPSVGGECALSTDVLEDRQEEFECLAAAVPRFASMLLAPEGDPDAPDIPTPRSYAEAITGPYSSQWQAAMDAKMASWKSKGTYVDEVPPLGVNIVDGMWIFRVKWPPGSPPAFKTCYVAQGFGQRQAVDYFDLLSHPEDEYSLGVASPPWSSCIHGNLKLLDLAAACRLDYATALFAESDSASPPSVGGECALSTDVLEDRQEEFECLAAAVPRFASMLLAPEGDPDAPDIPTPRSYAEAITGPYSSQWQAAMDAEMASWKSKGTYVDEVPPLGVNIVDGMWIFRVKWPPGSPPAFKTCYVAQGFGQRQAVDYFDLLSHPEDEYSLGVATRRCSALRRPVYGLRQVPREWYHTVRTTVAALGFAPSTADPSLFLRTDTSLPPFYVLVYVDDLVFATADTEALTLVKSEPQKRHTCTDLEPSGPYPELVGCLMYLMTYTRPDLAYPLNLFARYMAPVRRVWGSCLEDGVQLSSLVTQMLYGSSCEAEIYAGAMAAQELCWLTYLLTDLGEQPRSPPVLRAAPPAANVASVPAATAVLTTTAATATAVTATAATATAATATAATTTAATMATPTILSFDAEGRPIQFDAWLDDLHLFPHITAKDDISLYDHASGTAPAPAETAASTARSQWQTRDAHARLAIRSHLQLDERAHFGQHKTAKALYDAVIARYSSPASATIGRLSLPYLFPDLAAFPTVADLITHLRTSDTRYRAALPAEFLAKNPPPMYLILYHLVTRLPDSLRAVRDHFLALCPTELTVPLVATLARPSLMGVPLPPFSPRSPLLPLSTTLVLRKSGLRLLLVAGARVVGARGARVVAVTAGEVEVEVEAVGAVGVVAVVGVVVGLGGSVVVEGVVAAVVVEGAGVEAVVVAAVGVVAAARVVVGVDQRSVEVRVGSSASSSVSERPRRPSSFTCGRPHTQQRCFSRLDDVWRAQFPDASELPRWADLLKKNIDIFALDFDVILGAMYALTITVEGDCYLRVPPDPGIASSEAAALCASASAAPDPSEATALGAGASGASGDRESAPSGTASTAALHTFTLDS